MSQGAESNWSGKFLEDIVEREFLARDISVFRHSQKRFNDDLFHRRWLLKRVPYTSIYNCRSVSEFVYRDLDRHDIRIECRWQESRGSVDEKFPYLLDNAKRQMPEIEVWLLIGGGGAKTKALAWLKREAEAVRHKTIRVLEIGEVRKLIRNLPTGPRETLPKVVGSIFAGAAA